MSSELTDQRNGVFPSNDVATWNGGVWPPAALRTRWQELFLAALTGTCANPTVTGSAAQTAAATADWALRIECERSMQGPQKARA
jgi:hypothetical protein